MSSKNISKTKRPLYLALLDRMEFKIAFKAGLAAFFSLYLGVAFAKLFNRPNSLLSGIWCVLSAFIVLQAHLGGTYRAAAIQFLGVLIGSSMGGIFTTLFGSNATSLGVSVILTVLLCSIFKLKESIRIACFSLTVVMLLWALNPYISPLMFGLFRILDSILGILIAVIITHTFWPAQATRKLRLNIAKTINYLNRFFCLEMSLINRPQNYEEMQRKLTFKISHLMDETSFYLQDSELELLTKTKSLENWSNLINHLKNIFEGSKELYCFNEYDLKRILDQGLRNQLENAFEAIVKAFKTLTGELKNKEILENKTNLSAVAALLNDELNRFRMTRETRKFQRQDVEHFFVFFYNLRLIIEELIKMEEQILVLNREPI